MNEQMLSCVCILLKVACILKTSERYNPVSKLITINTQWGTWTDNCSPLSHEKVIVSYLKFSLNNLCKENYKHLSRISVTSFEFFFLFLILCISNVHRFPFVFHLLIFLSVWELIFGCVNNIHDSFLCFKCSLSDWMELWTICSSEKCPWPWHESCNWMILKGLFEHKPVCDL